MTWSRQDSSRFAFVAPPQGTRVVLATSAGRSQRSRKPYPGAGPSSAR
jgi:hypothetical protein